MGKFCCATNNDQTVDKSEQGSFFIIEGGGPTEPSEIMKRELRKLYSGERKGSISALEK
jgi:hypothetical protein